MTCYNPLLGWQSIDKTVNGKHYFTTDLNKAYKDKPMQIACGQCIGCRLERSRQWAIRIMHETHFHKENCFVTLTYRDEKKSISLNKRDMQLFLKKLRKKLGKKKIRFFQCGEYGDINKRAHHHIIIFGYKPDDLILYKVVNGNQIFISSELEEIWGHGFVTIGNVTFESAAYVARYIMKKVNGDLAEEHYKKVSILTGEVVNIEPEYITMSRRPGIANEFIKKYKDEIYIRDSVFIRDKFFVKPPKYYDKLYEIDNADEMRIIKSKRKSFAEQSAENTWERRETKKLVQQSKLLKRSL